MPMQVRVLQSKLILSFAHSILPVAKPMSGEELCSMSPGSGTATLAQRRPSPHLLAMCGRFTREFTWEEVNAFLSVMGAARNLRPRYNIAPTTTIDVARLNSGRPA